MKKTSLYLEPALDRAIARRASEDGVTKAEYIRRALADATQPRARRRPRGRGTFRGPANLAEQLDRHLAESGFGER